MLNTRLTPINVNVIVLDIWLIENNYFFAVEGTVFN